MPKKKPQPSGGIFSQDFIDFLKLLNEKEVQYLIIGGWAVIFHGHSRFTGDIDIWINNDADTAQRILKAVNSFGFTSLKLKEEDFTRDRQVIRFGNPPYRIDIIIASTDFENAWKKRIRKKIDGIFAYFVNLDYLLKLKRAAGRPKDLDDIRRLQPGKKRKP